MGNRLPQEMNIRLREMIETGVTVPSLSHYVKSVRDPTLLWDIV